MQGPPGPVDGVHWRVVRDGPGVERPNDREDNVFTIHIKDAKGEDVTEGGAPFQVYITLTDKPKPKKEKAKPELTEMDEEGDSSSSSEEDDPEDAFMAFIDPEADDGEKKPAEEGAQEKKDEEAKPEEKPKGTPIPQKQVGDISVEVYDNGDGTYDCHYKTETGKITTKVELNGQKVAKSPYKLEVEEDTDSDSTGVENLCAAGPGGQP